MNRISENVGTLEQQLAVAEESKAVHGGTTATLNRSSVPSDVVSSARAAREEGRGAADVEEARSSESSASRRSEDLGMIRRAQGRDPQRHAGDEKSGRLARLPCLSLPPSQALKGISVGRSGTAASSALSEAENKLDTAQQAPALIVGDDSEARSQGLVEGDAVSVTLKTPTPRDAAVPGVEEESLRVRENDRNGEKDYDTTKAEIRQEEKAPSVRRGGSFSEAAATAQVASDGRDAGATMLSTEKIDSDSAFVDEESNRVHDNDERKEKDDECDIARAPTRATPSASFARTGSSLSEADVAGERAIDEHSDVTTPSARIPYADSSLIPVTKEEEPLRVNDHAEREEKKGDTIDTARRAAASIPSAGTGGSISRATVGAESNWRGAGATRSSTERPESDPAHIPVTNEDSWRDHENPSCDEKGDTTTAAERAAGSTSPAPGGGSISEAAVIGQGSSHGRGIRETTSLAARSSPYDVPSTKEVSLQDHGNAEREEGEGATTETARKGSGRTPFAPKGSSFSEAAVAVQGASDDRGAAVTTPSAGGSDSDPSFVLLIDEDSSQVHGDDRRGESVDGATETAGRASGRASFGRRSMSFLEPAITAQGPLDRQGAGATIPSAVARGSEPSKARREARNKASVCAESDVGGNGRNSRKKKEQGRLKAPDVDHPVSRENRSSERNGVLAAMVGSLLKDKTVVSSNSGAGNRSSAYLSRTSGSWTSRSSDSQSSDETTMQETDKTR